MDVTETLYKLPETLLVCIFLGHCDKVTDR